MNIIVEFVSGFAFGVGVILAVIVAGGVLFWCVRHKFIKEVNSLTRTRKLLNSKVIPLVEKAFGDREKAIKWLFERQVQLNGKMPVTVVRTEADVHLIEELLHQVSIEKNGDEEAFQK